MVSIRAQALTSFEAPSATFLSVVEHEVVTLKEMQAEGYYLCENQSGIVGWVPVGVMKKSAPLRPVADYAAAEGNEDEISLREGVIAFGLKREGDWWYGESLGLVGWFPATYVEPMEVTVPLSKAANPGRCLSPEKSPKEKGSMFASPAIRKADPTSPAPPPKGKAEAGKGEAGKAPNAAGAAGDAKGKPPATKPRKDTLLFALWAHNMGLASALTVLVMAPFAILWARIAPYHCLLSEDLTGIEGSRNISALYIRGRAGNVCQAGGFCCDPVRESVSVPTHGSLAVGLYCLALAPLLLAFENTNWGLGLRFPFDAWFVRSRFPLHALLYLGLGIYPCFAYPTVMGGVFMLLTAITYAVASARQEMGDGGRAQRQKAKGAKRPETPKKPLAEVLNGWLNPYEWYRKARDEDTLAVNAWLLAYATVNLLIFCYTYAKWELAREAQVSGLRDGTLTAACDTFACKVNQAIIKFGPLSVYAPWAKACGNCLNFNCALILVPVLRMLLRHINNVGVSFSNAQRNASLFARLFAHPLTRYIPLSKNIAFHKLIAMVVLGFTVCHTIFHWLNYWKAPEVTLARFAKFGWGGTTYLTGSVICLAMFFIYTAAPNHIRFAKYEMFFGAHHWFIIFFLFLLAHGPVFYAWAVLPLVLYVCERYMRVFRGNRSYIVNKVEWIPPVMAIQFRPDIKEQFQFKEGQYLYLNCPHINADEWHPFTISSAQDDLYSGPRISLETGEEVVEVPRPKDLPAIERWAKYCPVSKDWTKLPIHELLDKHETGYNDYVSVHIKVHGLEDPEAVTWTRRLKEYFELMNPGNPFPYYFRRRDERGDIQIGKRNGPDGKPILRVDGPHSAPSEHYCNYNTCMIVGAGIGLTPCSSILTALLKYRWSKNFKPELLHFYWVVRQDEVDAFQWFIHHLADLEYRLKGNRQSGAVGARYYVEINIYITSAAKDPLPEKPMRAASKTYSSACVEPSFTAQQLYSRMLNPSVKSSTQFQSMADLESPARLQDVWIWNGRPYWDDIFANMKKQRQHPDIGVCFCGTPVIGKDLKAMCRKYTSMEEDCTFTLHKENF